MKNLLQRILCWFDIKHKFPVQPDFNSAEYPFRLLKCEYCDQSHWVWNRPDRET